ncbi:lysozyme inhibitor LprI family protein [Oribacterium sp. WCC10]|uniref:lysozyme inhibitor LprI family protein n=1 Tax=Oribacterium sp. WCC10 TaxID=1855343 RepID=UPI0008DF4844|nr:lysozyme inhibitor LprI family protein [Oribacterium sp. WCC10]SFG50800.1 Protein of unknown function [Oribacterium sp. WCC10]
MRLRNIIIGCLLLNAVALSGCGTNAGSTAAPDSSAQETESASEPDEEKTVNITVTESEKSSSENVNIGTNTSTGNKNVSTETDSDNDKADSSEDDSSDSERDVDSDSTDIWNSKDRDLIFNHDFTDDIKQDIAGASASSSSLNEELSQVQKVTEKYDELFKVCEAQLELNMAAGYTYMIWDEELNSLWKRFSASADASTKERVLKDEQNWISMKEEVVIDNLGRREDGGSMYPMLENSFLREITENRCVILASELARIKGEDFNMPERNIYGTYVDNQGTGNVYSSLIMRKGWENEDEAIVSLYRVGEIFGTFTKKTNDEYSFESNDETIKGIIRIKGWDGASFEVTEAGDSILAAGDKFDFGFVF